jgi:cytochrome c-type biogenesis protein
LFAPCCNVFLAPSYMAAAVKNRRWRLLPLTFVFAAGLALVLVPITLGMSLVPRPSATIKPRSTTPTDPA